MIRLTGRVQFRDGRVVEFDTGTAAIAAYELYATRNGLPIGTAAPPMLTSLVIAHHAIGADEGFDVWVESVDGVELDSPEGAVVPPIRLERSGA